MALTYEGEQAVGVGVMSFGLVFSKSVLFIYYFGDFITFLPNKFGCFDILCYICSQIIFL